MSAIAALNKACVEAARYMGDFNRAPLTHNFTPGHAHASYVGPVENMSLRVMGGRVVLSLS